MISKLSQLIYGGNFHPEAWPEALWTEDVALMRRAGVNLVTIGASCWSRLQSGPDTYTFDWLDRVFDLLNENGILICLATGTNSIPPWFARLYPEALAASSEGAQTLHYLNSPAYREQSGRLVRQLATRFGASPALAVWQVTQRPVAQNGACHCERCATQFRIWLQQRYKTLDVLNEHWGTGHSSQFYHQWEEILPPGGSAFPDPAQQLDYRRFASDSLLASLLDEKSILRELTPEVPVTTNFSGENGMAPAVNGFEWARHVDFISFDSNPDPAETEASDIAFSYDVQRGFGGGKPWLLRQVSAQAGARAQNPVKRPDQTRLWSYQALAHGADGVTFSRWRAASAGAEKFGGAILPHGFTETRSFREAEQLGGELKKLSSIRGAVTRAEVALIVDWENMCAVELDSQLARTSYLNIVRDYYRALFEPDVPIDIVPPETDLANYKIVVAPALHLVPPGVAENFQSFVDKGGTFLTTFLSGM
ncbi:MAG TPA: beta-galactosidase, partial [Verrucomicrobiae bacterium]